MEGEPNGAEQKTPQTLEPWYRILRLPLLLTIPGEPVAGFLLASAASGQSKPLGVMLAAVGAALFFAVFGHLLNDLLDLSIDETAHPDRPLPSGEITVPQARMAAVVSVLSGLNLALFAGRPVLYAGVVLCCLLLARHAFLKRIPVIGACTAGLCRALSFLFGVLAVMPDWISSGRFLESDGALLWVALACVTLYTAAVAHLARRAEKKDGGRMRYHCVSLGSSFVQHRAGKKDRGGMRWLPLAVLLPYLAGLMLLASLRQNGEAAVSASKTAATSALAFLSAVALLRGWLLGGILYRSQPIKATVFGHFGNLLLIQGALCSAAGTAGLFPAVTFILLSVLFARFRR
ncbi:MAG: UbiA family prenyltransferase [Kiritimatiellae bacterium]|nr:UbiA family prenyltransferase [Kiritimatiellia bacterium]